MFYRLTCANRLYHTVSDTPPNVQRSSFSSYLSHLPICAPLCSPPRDWSCSAQASTVHRQPLLRRELVLTVAGGQLPAPGTARTRHPVASPHDERTPPGLGLQVGPAPNSNRVTELGEGAGCQDLGRLGVSLWV